MSRRYLCPCLNDAFLRLRQVVFVQIVLFHLFTTQILNNHRHCLSEIGQP